MNPQKSSDLLKKCTINGQVIRSQIKKELPIIREIIEKMPDEFYLYNCVDMDNQKWPEKNVWELMLLGINTGLLEFEALSRMVTKKTIQVS